MVTRAESANGVWAVVLAAGESNRYGSSKLLATYRGETLVGRAVREAQSVCGARTLLLTGHDADRVAEAAARHEPETLFNPGYRRGIGNTLAQAAAGLSGRASAMLVLLGDQPLVTAGHLRALLEAWDGSGDLIVATRYGDTSGVPALLPKDTFAAIRKFDDDRGAKRLFGDPRFRLMTVRCDAAAADIDTPADLEKLYGEE